LSGYNLE